MMDTTLHEALGVPYSSVIEVKRTGIIESGFRYRVEKNLLLTLSGETAPDVTILLLLGHYEYRLAQSFMSEKLKQFIDSVRRVFPNAVSIILCDSAEHGKYYRLFNENGQLVYQLYDSPLFNGLDLGAKYSLTPAEVPWRKVAIPIKEVKDEDISSSN